MLRRSGKLVFLRDIEPKDVTPIHRIENNKELWAVSDTKEPYTLEIIEKYVANAHLDITKVGQLRLMICDTQSTQVLGMIDLYDYDAYHLRAGVGIVIEQKKNRGRGLGKEALKLFLDFCKKDLKMHQVFANIGEDNLASIALFEGANFNRVGIKKEWRRQGATFSNEVLYQIIL